MSLVTRQNLMAEKTRFAISVGGVALSVFLIMFLLSLFQGWRVSVGRFVDHVDADIWVAREGTTDFLNAASVLGPEVGTEVAAIDGVERVDALIVRPMDVDVGGGRREPLHLVGYELDGAGGPPKLVKGRNPPGRNEVVIDEAFGKKAGLSVGDSLQTSGRSLDVIGLSSGGNLVFSQTAFVSIESARELLSMGDLTTFYLVQLEPGTDADAVSADIEAALPSVGAFPKAAFAQATRDRIMRNMIPILVVILGLAFVVGVAITGLTIYNATVEKQREYGILKAIGFTNGYLFRLVLEQSLATGLLGFAIGAGLTAIAVQFISDVVPQFVTLLRWQDVVFVLCATLVMSALAALLPVRRLASVDPVKVFAS